MRTVVHILVTLGFSIGPLPRVTRVPRVTNEGNNSPYDSAGCRSVFGER